MGSWIRKRSRLLKLPSTIITLLFNCVLLSNFVILNKCVTDKE